MSPESLAGGFACAAAGGVRNLQLYGSERCGSVTDKHGVGHAATKKQLFSQRCRGSIGYWAVILCLYSWYETALSIPDDVFARAEGLAHQTKRFRSRIFSDALREYLARHSPDEITNAMNRASAEIGDTRYPFIAEAARCILERSEWSFPKVRFVGRASYSARKWIFHWMQQLPRRESPESHRIFANRLAKPFAAARAVEYSLSSGLGAPKDVRRGRPLAGAATA